MCTVQNVFHLFPRAPPVVTLQGRSSLVRSQSGKLLIFTGINQLRVAASERVDVDGQHGLQGAVFRQTDLVKRDPGSCGPGSDLYLLLFTVRVEHPLRQEGSNQLLEATCRC